MTDHLHALPAGHQLNEYRIEDVIGSGGFGITYKALDTQLDKVVAIKEYLPSDFAVRTDATTVRPKSTADQDDYQWGLDRFLDEARTLARFEHPHLNHVRRFFEDNNTAYLVLDHIEGETLSDLLKREGRLESIRLQRLVTELLSGLDEVHSAGYVHRDIKPSNIMVRENGSSVLLDFGAARQVLGQRSKSLTSVLTPGYAPIEQYDTKGDDIGPWTDIYALGMVAYRCVSGISETELIDAVKRARLARKGRQDQDMKSAVEVGKGLYPLPLLKAIDWAIKVEEEDRPQSVAAIKEMLAGDEVSDNAPDAVPVDKPAKQSSPPKSDRFGEWFGVAAVVLLLAFAFTWWRSEKAEREGQEGTGRVVQEIQAERERRDAERVARAERERKEAARRAQIEREQREEAERLAAAQKCPDYYIHEDYTKVLEWCRLAANQGDAEAQSNLGWMYQNGYGVIQNNAEAVKWYRKAAEKEDQYAQNRLGEMYSTGKGVAQDYTEAVKWYRKAAEQGHALGQNNLGWMYENGNGVAQNDIEAVKWYRKAAEQGDAWGQYSLGTIYQNGHGVAQDYTEAVKWYRKSAEQGDALGQAFLGNMYAEGYGVPQDDTEAEKWYRKAAEQGNALGQYNLGVMYQNGYGVAQDDAEAVKWYRKAAEQGNALGQYNLGVMYQNGYGVIQNNAEAVKWYRKAAEQGDAFGQNALGEMYENGQGVAKNHTEAVKWYRKAAEQGEADAQDNLGKMYWAGKGVSQDYTVAVKWFRKSADQGHVEGQSHLGVMYSTGKGIDRDYTESVKWYRKSADQGHAPGQFNLGAMYLDGRGGIRRNTRKARELFRKAAAQGHTGAKEALKNL